MGWLDITMGAEDQQIFVGAHMFAAGAVLTATGVGSAAGIGLMSGGAGMMASGQQAKSQRSAQEDAIKDQKKEIEKARYDTVLRQVSAEIQADQTMLASLGGESDNGKGRPGINTKENQQIGSSTSGTF